MYFKFLNESKKEPTIDMSKPKDNEEAGDKMDDWHNGKRKENVKACSDEKLQAYYKVCKNRKYNAECAELKAEADKRGITLESKQLSNDKKALYESIMTHVAIEVKKVLNEGAGAGYDVILSGLNATNIILGEVEEKDGEEVLHFTAQLVPGIIDEWQAESYYDGISSNSPEYDDEDRMVDGGSISGYVSDSMAKSYGGRSSADSEENAKAYIADQLSGFTVKQMFGSGWVHVDLENPIVFENVEVSDDYGAVFIDRMEVDAEMIATNINWFFKHEDDDIEEEY